MFVGPICVSHGKHLLHSSCLPIHLPACISIAPLDGFSWILILRIILKIYWENPNLVKIIIYWILYMKNWVCFILLAVKYVAWQYREHISMLSWQNFLYSWHCWQWHILISVINQLDAQNFCFTKVYFMPLHVSSTCAHYQEVRIALHSLWYHHTYRWLSCAQVERGPSHPVHKTTTCRCDDTRGCVMQFWPPDDEHMCLKHVEAWNKLIIKQKFCA